MKTTSGSKCKYKTGLRMCLTLDVECFSKKTGTVHKVLAANKNAKAMASDPRHDMRYNLRAKISQKDYVDKAMK